MSFHVAGNISPDELLNRLDKIEKRLNALETTLSDISANADSLELMLKILENIETFIRTGRLSDDSFNEDFGTPV